MVFAITLVTVFAAQVALYRYISSKLRTRKRIKERLAAIRTSTPQRKPAPMYFHNRPGEN